MIGEVTGERLFQQQDLLAQGAPGQLGQHLRVAFPGDQRGHHVTAGGSEDVGGHHAELDLRVFEQLLGAVLPRGAGRHQVGAVAGQVAKLADLGRGNEAGADHLPPGDLAQPDRIQFVGLGAAGQVPDILGAGQPGLEPGGFQQVKHRLGAVPVA